MGLALKSHRLLTDLELAQAARSGDLHAFDLLVRRHYPRVFRILRRLLGRDEDAEDAAQEVMLAAWRNLPRFRGEAAFATWLYAVTVRRGSSAARGLFRRKLIPWEDALADRIPGDRRREPQRAVERSEESEKLRRALSRLPEKQRTVVALYYYGEMPCREIAESLGIEEATVRGHLKRARETLRRLLPEMGEGSR